MKLIGSCFFLGAGIYLLALSINKSPIQIDFFLFSLFTLNFGISFALHSFKEKFKSNNFIIKRRKISYGISSLFISLMFFEGLFRLYQDNFKIITTEQVTSVAIVVSEKLKLKGQGYRDGPPFVEIKALEYPEFDFILAGVSYTSIITENLVSKIEKGDTLEIQVLTPDYKKKLNHLDDLSYLDKHYEYFSIPVIGISHKNLAILDINKRNLAVKKQKKYRLWVYSILSITAALFGFLLIYEGFRTNGNTN